MLFAHPTSGERFYLQLLLTVVKGPTSFKDLCTFSDITYPTFKAACLARGLLEDDSEWKLCLEKAATMKSGKQLHLLFVTILKDCVLSFPEALWDQFKEYICDVTLKYKLQNKGFENPSDDQLWDYSLYLIDQDLCKDKKALNDFSLMPLPQLGEADLDGNRLLAKQLAYNNAQKRQIAEKHIPSLNAKQRTAFDTIVDAIINNH